MTAINSHARIEAKILSVSPFIKPYFHDLDTETASRAFYATSHSPEERGAYLRSDYARLLLADHEEVKKTINLAIKKGADVQENWESELEFWFAAHRKGLKQGYETYISAHSRCMSSMIVGPARFPVGKAQKANDAADKRFEEVKVFSSKSKKYILNELLPYGDGSAIRTDDPKAINKLEEKVKSLCAARDTMKAINAVVRKYFKRGNPQITEESRIACIKEVQALTQWEQSKVEELLKPNYAGRIVAFEAYALTNIGAQIKTAEKRAEEVESAQSASIEDDFGNGITAEISDDSKIMVTFSDIPSESIRSVLKANAFKWSRQRGAWVRKVTGNALAAYERNVKSVLAAVET